MSTSSTKKMQWFIDNYNQNHLNYILWNTGMNYGTVVMPTGTGKSGVVYEDIVRTIDELAKDKKLIINISCPILKLTQQFISDLFEVLAPIYKSRGLHVAFFVNSSDNGRNYNSAEVKRMNIQFKKLKDLNSFADDLMSDVAIVASCHKSMPKFIKVIKSQNFIGKNIDVISYIDESHLIDVRNNNEDDQVVKLDIDTLCKFSTKVYALTATPDSEVVTAINRWNILGNNSANYIHHVRPIEAIRDNIILPPHVSYIKTDTDGISINMLKAIMKDTCKNNPDIHHKILVTLKGSEELKAMRDALEKEGYKVFSTCDKYKYGTSLEEDLEYSDVTGFIDDIDNYQGDCFVLHIRQLIQGIDIKSLTDCVILSADHGSKKSYRHTVQIIGRTLRPLFGERGLNKTLRKKKVGEVYFITPSDDASVQDYISQFVCRYYGFDNVTFDEKSYGSYGTSNDDLFETFKEVKLPKGWLTNSITELLINIENYIKVKVVPMVTLYTKMGKNINVDAEAERILNKFDVYGATFDSAELLDNVELLDAVKNLIEKYVPKKCESLF